MVLDIRYGLDNAKDTIYRTSIIFCKWKQNKDTDIPDLIYDISRSNIFK